MPDPDPLALLRVLVRAHRQSGGRTGGREPIWYVRALGGTRLQHPGLPDELPDFDEALLEDLHAHGLVDIDYGSGGSWNITPTATGREMVEQHDRILSGDPVADVQPLLDAIDAQAQAPNKLAWPAARPVLDALRRYWEDGGFSRHGIQLGAILRRVPGPHERMFAATIDALVAGDYLRPTGDLEANGVPAEVVITDRARAVLSGWPGATPDELVENLLAVLTVSADGEQDPARKKRLERVAETVRELGVSTASEVLAKVLMGG